mmetsp:Transcript_93471/g.185452  ORF Transcript_93471/g.185452 Transcript_93471/m.185452 type:complete len:92 (+) Transcript_93471:122-397(+)
MSPQLKPWMTGADRTSITLDALTCGWQFSKSATADDVKRRNHFSVCARTSSARLQRSMVQDVITNPVAWGLCNRLCRMKWPCTRPSQTDNV